MMDWHARYHRAALQGMRALTLEERGAYQTVLDLIYDHGGPISDDARWLAGWMGVSVRKWSALREALIEKGKLDVSPGFISNFRATFELEKSVKLQRKLSENGAKGGAKSAETRAKAKENNDDPPSAASTVAARETSAPVKLIDTTRQDRVVVDVAQARDFKAMISEAQARAGPACNLTSGSVHHVADLRRLVDAGCDWEADVLPAIDRISASFIAKRRQFSSWVLLNEPAIENRDRRIAGLPAPSQPLEQTNGRSRNAGNGDGAAWDAVCGTLAGDAASGPRPALAMGKA